MLRKIVFVLIVLGLYIWATGRLVLGYAEYQKKIFSELTIQTKAENGQVEVIVARGVPTKIEIFLHSQDSPPDSQWMTASFNGYQAKNVSAGRYEIIVLASFTDGSTGRQDFPVVVP